MTLMDIISFSAEINSSEAKALDQVKQLLKCKE